MNYKNCQNCENVGFYSEGDVYDPEQVQCEFCYTEPNSIFNVINGLQQKLEAAEAKLATAGYDAVMGFELPEMDSMSEWHYISESIREYANKLKAGDV